MSPQPNSTPLACKIEDNIFSADQKERYRTIRQKMQVASKGLKELPDGYAIRFPMETSLFMTLAEFITLESLCCAFFKFFLELDPETETVWLGLTGGEGVKEFLQLELASLNSRQNSQG